MNDSEFYKLLKEAENFLNTKRKGRAFYEENFPS